MFFCSVEDYGSYIAGNPTVLNKLMFSYSTPDVLNSGSGCMKKNKLHLSNLYVPDITIVVFGELKNAVALANTTSIH